MGATQNNTQPSPATGAQPWTSESAKTQTSVSAVAAEASSFPVENAVEEFDIDASDGTTGETEAPCEALTAALSDFFLHADKAAYRTVSISDAEKKRINDAMSRAENDNPVPHSILITVKASVALATCQAASGKLATTNLADSTSKDFARYLEELVITALGSGAGATFKFSRIRKGGGMKAGEFVSACFKLAFAEKVFCGRILRSKLSAHGTVIKKDFTLNMSYEVVVLVAPFEGQVYHCPIIVDFKDKKDLSVPGMKYVSAAFQGGMNSKAFIGIRRGQTIKTDGSGKQIHDFS